MPDIIEVHSQFMLPNEAKTSFLEAV
jgi:hypothetical protein